MAIRIFNQIKPKIGKGVFVDASAVVTGKVTLKDNVSIWPNVSIRGDLLAITIGTNSNIQDNSVIHTTQPLTPDDKGFDTLIGDHVTVGHSAIIHGCHIGNRVLIGMGAIILDGAVIEEEVMVGAGTIVSPGKTLLSGYLYLGSPAKRIRALSEREKQQIYKNAENYIQLKNQHICDAKAYQY